MLAATITFAIKTITITTTITTITEIETTETEEEEAVTESSEGTTDEMTDFVMTEERTAVGTDGQCSPLSFTPLPHYPLPPSLHSCILSLCSHIPLSSLISQPQQFFTLIDLTSLAQVVRFTMRKHLSSTH